MLSTFNLPGKNVSPDRQMAMMRTYLTQLKDEIESELYNVKWENLSKPLQDKINSLEKYQADSDDKINFIKANYVETDYLRANYITAQQISAAYATFDWVSANYASFTWVEALDAMVGNLNAIAITTQNLSAQTIYGSQIVGLTINANQITAGTISSDRVDFSTGIASTVAVNDTLLVGYKRYSQGSSNVYVEINRYGIVINDRSKGAISWQWDDIYNAKYGS